MISHSHKISTLAHTYLSSQPAHCHTRRQRHTHADLTLPRKRARILLHSITCSSPASQRSPVFGCCGCIMGARGGSRRLQLSSVPKPRPALLDTRITAASIIPESCRFAAPCRVLRVLRPLQAHHCDRTDTRLSLSTLRHPPLCTPSLGVEKCRHASPCAGGQGHLISTNSMPIKCLASPKPQPNGSGCFEFGFRPDVGSGSRSAIASRGGPLRDTLPDRSSARRRKTGDHAHCLCMQYLRGTRTVLASLLPPPPSGRGNGPYTSGALRQDTRHTSCSSPNTGHCPGRTSVSPVCGQGLPGDPCF